MKRSIIILTITLLLISIGIWVYVFFSTPQTNSTETFSDLNLGDTTDTLGQPFREPSEQPVVDVTGPEKLRQLTTRPVLGYRDIMVGTSSDRLVQFVEAGTGHIYLINLTTGAEERISNNTIVGVASAAISLDGRYVAVKIGHGLNKNVQIITVDRQADSNRAVVTEFPVAVTDFSITQAGELLYTQSNTLGTAASLYDLETKTTRSLFNIPFVDAAIRWSADAAGPHLIYPKTASQLEGYLYEVMNGVFTRLPISGYGLSAVGNEQFVLYSKIENTNYINRTLWRASDSTVDGISYPYLPDKCSLSPHSSTTVVCAFSIGDTFSTTAAEDWYSGIVSYQDSLWEVRPLENAIIRLSDPLADVGRGIDIQNIVVSQSGEQIYFTSKQDRSLWLYDKVASN